MELHLKHQENHALRGHLEEEQVNKYCQYYLTGIVLGRKIVKEIACHFLIKKQ